MLSGHFTTEDRKVAGSNSLPLASLRNFGNFPYSPLPVSFGRDTPSRWSGGYARTSKISQTGRNV